MSTPTWDKKSIISKSAHFAVGSAIEGDYYEFGVFQGQSIASAYFAFELAYKSLLERHGAKMQDWNKKRIADQWSSMKFHGFDSFEGLPEIGADDKGGPFSKGNYACAQEDVLNNLTSANVPSDKIIFHKGWYRDFDTKFCQNLRKASVIHIDCDLYESTVDALGICRDLIQDGTIIIFDDWYQFKGSPDKGEQRAFREWSSALQSEYHFTEYHKEDIWRNSFIINVRSSS